MENAIPFDNSFAGLPAPFYTRQIPTPVRDPQLVAWNDDLAALLRLPELRDKADIFAGNQIPAGADPLAQAYAGHQFGHYNPQLGDGRAILLGETIGADGIRRDIQLKGAGRTPYSRMGDGRAWLGPVLREYVVSEAMFALNIPTTRALAAVTTGEDIYRQQVLPGAILTRVAQSHLRVGQFQYFAARGDKHSLQQLTKYAIDRHYPDANGPMDLLRAVCAAQTRLITAWMGVGFIHGVMNTDNCSIAGETIDYGPCAFIDTYHPDTVFSSIDQNGRYAYSNQPGIITWNMAQFATALIQQMDDRTTAAEEATDIVHAMPTHLHDQWLATFRTKIGLSDAKPEDETLITDLLALMSDQQADFTNTFRTLATPKARDQFTDPTAFDAWHKRWKTRLNGHDPAPQIARTNPAIIPRNHRIEQMITAATQGDFARFHRLTQALKTPFETTPDNAELTTPPTQAEIVPATFCGT